MWNRLRRWRTRRILSRTPIQEPDWQHALARCAPARRLPAGSQARLRVLATLFLHEKAIEPVAGLELNPAMRTLLAVHACLPILELGLWWYRSLHALVIYPDLFIPKRAEMDDAGVVHHTRTALEGEAWLQGPVVLSWEAVTRAGLPRGHNVVVHELAHKLDMLNGAANGFPPLHRGMRHDAWTRAFEDAYQEHTRRWQTGAGTPLDPYGLENPGEFFAVASELFFEQPRALKEFSSDLYHQLSLFYRQHPADGLTL